MIYSIAVMDLCDFEAIGRKMPKGTGVDATVDNGALVPKHKPKRRKTKAAEVATGHGGILKVLELGDVQETKMKALRMLLEFGSHTDKQKAKQDLYSFSRSTSNSGRCC
jgi:hypothetical protein